nr:helix-turn-helix domain-containing protein [Prevotella amnii]
MKYHQLTSEQRSQILALLQKKTGRKEIAAIVGISQSTLSREIKRNSTPSGKYIWTKVHDMAMQRRKRTVKNARLSDELVWRIKEYITNGQWSLRQISGYLRKNDGIKVSHQSIYNIIHNDTGTCQTHKA